MRVAFRAGRRGDLLQGQEAAVQGQAGLQEDRQFLGEIHHFPGGNPAPAKGQLRPPAANGLFQPDAQGDQAALLQVQHHLAFVSGLQGSLGDVAARIRGPVVVHGHGYSWVTRKTSWTVVKPWATLRQPSPARVCMPRLVAFCRMVPASARWIISSRIGSSTRTSS